jgi:hypothetical protein
MKIRTLAGWGVIIAILFPAVVRGAWGTAARLRSRQFAGK